MKPQTQQALAAPGTTPDLFAQVRVTDEWSLAERIKQLGMGADLWVDGDFPTFRDRLRFVIQREQLASCTAGRTPAGQHESIAAAFERVTGEPLAPKKARAKA